MTPLLVLRHGPTDWNADRRIQGRADPPLSAAGARTVAGWRLPEDAHTLDWATSPLRRAVETARLLGIAARPDPRLIEMDWGAWEGAILDRLRAQGHLTPELERAGLRFRPPDGESPAEVQDRIRPWLAEIGGRGRPTGAVTHKGVIRALYAIAVGWDMTDDPPAKLRDGCAHRFLLADDGSPVVDRLNIAL